MHIKFSSLATGVLAVNAATLGKRGGPDAAPALPDHTTATFAIGGMTSADATAAPRYVPGCQLFAVSAQVVPPQSASFNGQFLHHINAACSRYLARVPDATDCATGAIGGSFSAHCGLPGVNDDCANLNPARSNIAHNRIVSATANNVTLSLFEVPSVDGNNLLTRCLIDQTYESLARVSIHPAAPNAAADHCCSGEPTKDWVMVPAISDGLSRLWRWAKTLFDAQAQR